MDVPKGTQHSQDEDKSIERDTRKTVFAIVCCSKTIPARVEPVTILSSLEQTSYVKVQSYSRGLNRDGDGTAAKCQEEGNIFHQERNTTKYRGSNDSEFKTC
jgi:hypothetical protein